MKKLVSISGMLMLAVLFMSMISIREIPQDKKVKKHIQVVKAENGKEMVLDTIIEGDNVFVWQGDTIGKGKDLKWISKEGFKLDSVHDMNFNFDMEYEIDVQDGEDGKVIIMKSGKDGKKIVKEFKTLSDHDVMLWHGDKGKNEMFFGVPPVPSAPHAPKAMFFGKREKSNVIDLSDPGIISYDKKKLKNGREKITIIRNEVKEEEVHEEIIMHGTGNNFILHDAQPGTKKSVRVIKKNGDGNVEIIEDEDVWSVKEGDTNVKVIKEDGKVIHIKEIKEGDAKKVEVKVEVEEEKKK